MDCVTEPVRAKVRRPFNNLPAFEIALMHDRFVVEPSTNRFKAALVRAAGYAAVLHYAAGAHPGVFYPLYALHTGFRSPRATRLDTEVVIEGFPRCGNTFATIAFTLAQGRPVKMADHLHVPAQIVRAARYGVPTCVVVREPSEVARSLVVKYPFLRPRDVLRGYLGYYRRCLDYSDAFVVAPFAQVITDFGSVIDALNGRFGTSFARFQHTEENVRQVYRLMDARNPALKGKFRGSYRPDSDKERAKAEVDLAGSEKLLARCREVYESVRKLAVEQSGG